jgi:hypothetical protein
MLSEAKHLWFIPLSGIGRKIDPRFFAFAQNDNLVWLLTQYEVGLYCIPPARLHAHPAAT